MRVIIGADVVPTNSNIDDFVSGDIVSLLGKDLAKIWLESDYRVFNLECPICATETPIIKNGPILHAGKEAINGILSLNPDVILLANNHIMDEGIEGLSELLDALDDRGVSYIGAGRNKDDIANHEHFIINSMDHSAAFYVCADCEFSKPAGMGAGANICDEDSFKAISKLKQDSDYVVVIYHGGKEHYRYPTPELQHRCRMFIDSGADIVICQHSHCVGCKEEYKNKTIIYGQGNFIFNKKRDDFWNNSVLVELVINDGIQVNYIPTVQTDKGIRLATKDESMDIIGGVNKRSLEIKDECFVNQYMSDYADSLIISYLYAFSGWNKYIVYFDKKILNGYLIKKRYSRKRCAAIWNYIVCDAHREMLVQGLENVFKGEK